MISNFGIEGFEFRVEKISTTALLQIVNFVPYGNQIF